MKLVVVFCLLFSFSAFALLSPTGEERAQFNDGRRASTLADGQLVIGNSDGFAEKQTLSGAISISSTGVVSMQDQTSDGVGVMRMLRVSYDTLVDGSGIAAYTLDAKLPANSIIFQSYFHIDRQFVDGGSGTVALSCEDADNIFTAADITGSGTGVLLAGNQVGSVATMSTGIAAECSIVATVATAGQTEGKLTLFILFSVHD